MVSAYFSNMYSFNEIAIAMPESAAAQMQLSELLDDVSADDEFCESLKASYVSRGKHPYFNRPRFKGKHRE